MEDSFQEKMQYADLYSHNKIHLNEEFECFMCDKIFKTIKKITVSITDFRRNIRIRSKGEEDFFSHNRQLGRNENRQMIFQKKE